MLKIKRHLKKKYFLFFFLCLGLFQLSAQKGNLKDKVHRWQVGINATNLLKRTTGVRAIIPVITSPYDLQLAFAPAKKINLRFGIGYQAPELEASSGAVDEANRQDNTFHLRLGISKNKFLFEDKWVWTLGLDYIYSKRVEKEFNQQELSLHINTQENGIGIPSSLQYFLSPRFSLGAEMALHLTFSFREQLLPVRAPFDPFSSFFEFFPPSRRVIGRIYAPIEVFVFYKL